MYLNESKAQKRIYFNAFSYENALVWTLPKSALKFLCEFCLAFTIFGRKLICFIFISLHFCFHFQLGRYTIHASKVSHYNEVRKQSNKNDNAVNFPKHRVNSFLISSIDLLYSPTDDGLSINTKHVLEN